MPGILDRIHEPNDLKALSAEELSGLAEEIRRYLISQVAQTGGHLSANLGVVELTLALCRCFDFPKDQIVFDVGHQSYVYKLLTGRKDRFDTLRKKDGLCGFPNPEESIYDLFHTGHASTSISSALGLACARDLNGGKQRVIAVIGDGAMTGGLAYEAMNHAGRQRTPMIVILNDNQMSIAPNVGALSRRLSKTRTRKNYLGMKRFIHSLLDPKDGRESKMVRGIRHLKRRITYFFLSGVFFEELGFTYLGPVDGHNEPELEKVLKSAMLLSEPVLIHVRTVKGKGYKPAEQNAEAFHGVSHFDMETGVIEESPQTSWSGAVGGELELMAQKEPKIAVICAAMAQGTGVEHFSQLYPKRFFDVGICEEHAVTFAGGLSKGGLCPFVMIYATFLQRAYDEIMQDVALQHQHVVLMIDHAGIVGEDGATHQGIFDLSYLGSMPGMTVLAPSCRSELTQMMNYARDFDGPISIRYPKGNICSMNLKGETIELGKGVFRKESGARILLLALGDCVETAVKAQQELEKERIPVDVVDARFAMPLSEDFYFGLAHRYDQIYTIEDHVRSGGYGMRVKDLIGDQTKVQILSLPDEFIPQGSRSEMLKLYGLSVDGVKEIVEKAYAKGC